MVRILDLNIYALNIKSLLKMSIILFPRADARALNKINVKSVRKNNTNAP